MSSGINAEDDKLSIAKECKHEPNIVVFDITVGIDGKPIKVEFICANPKELYTTDGNFENLIMKWKYKPQSTQTVQRYTMLID